MDYTGRFRPKGVPFSGWRYIQKDKRIGRISKYVKELTYLVGVKAGTISRREVHKRKAGKTVNRELK